MFKVSVGTLALLAAPAGQQLELPPPPSPPLPGEETVNYDNDGDNNNNSHARAAAGSALVEDDGTSGGGGLKPAAQQRALSAPSASVRPQLELLRDLSRAVGHAETALVCASLLRDMAGATAMLGQVCLCDGMICAHQLLSGSVLYC